MAKKDDDLEVANAQQQERAREQQRISIIERRLQNPFGEPSAPITFREPGRVARWFNGAIIADKIWRAKNKGWTPVTVPDLADPDQVGGFTKSPEGFVTRGDRGAEVLMWMYARDYDAIQLAKARENVRNMGSPSKQRAEALEAYGNVNAAGAEIIDRQGRRSGPIGGVTDQYERIQRTPEAIE